MTMGYTSGGWRRTGATVAVLACAAALTGCAGEGAPAGVVEVAATNGLPSPSPSTVIVPDIIGQQAALVGKNLPGLTAILRYEPAVVAAPGTVVSTDPAKGTVVAAGSVVTVVIAGQAAQTLDGLVEAHRETFVGVTADSYGLSVAIYRRADIRLAIAQLDSVVAGKQYRVQLCDRSYAELSRIEIELSRREFVPDAGKYPIGLRIDPQACAVHLTIGGMDHRYLPELLERYDGALVVSFETIEVGIQRSVGP
jgi:hypothetical protein